MGHIDEAPAHLEGNEQSGSSALGTLRLRGCRICEWRCPVSRWKCSLGHRKGSCGKGRLARHLRRGANETMRIDEIIVRGMTERRGRD